MRYILRSPTGLMDRMFRTFDHDTDGYLNQMEWLAGLWIFLKGNLIEQATYCFQIYDIDEDGYISKDDMFQLLKSSLRPAVVKGVNYRTQTDRRTPSPSLPQITQGKGEDGQAGVEREAGSERAQEDKQTTGPDVMSHEDDPDEGARDLSEIAVTLLDRDGDGRISLDDYLTSIQSDPLLLEVVGPCLPTSSRAAAVLAALGSNNAPNKARQPARPNPS